MNRTAKWAALPLGAPAAPALWQLLQKPQHGQLKINSSRLQCLRHFSHYPLRKPGSQIGGQWLQW